MNSFSKEEREAWNDLMLGLAKLSSKHDAEVKIAEEIKSLNEPCIWNIKPYINK